MNKSIKAITIVIIMMMLIACVWGGQKALPTMQPMVDKTQIPSVEPIVIKTQIASKDGMTLMDVPAGEFQMGSTEAQYQAAFSLCVKGGDKQADCQKWDADQKPLHVVYLDAFWIDQTDVTTAQFKRFVNDSGYKTDNEKKGQGLLFNFQSLKWEDVDGANWKRPAGGASDNPDTFDKYPVIQVSWNDAVAYCQWAGRRLPTEAEWEKAARGTDGRIYPWGNQKPAGNLLNFADKNLPLDWSDNSADDGYKLTSPVGNYPAGASPYGALDMEGNVSEWVADWYDATYYSNSPNRNPQGPDSGTERSKRGSSWIGMDEWIFAMYRDASKTWDRGDDRTGFRCVMSAAAPTN